MGPKSGQQFSQIFDFVAHKTFLHNSGQKRPETGLCIMYKLCGIVLDVVIGLVATSALQFETRTNDSGAACRLETEQEKSRQFLNRLLL